MIREPREPCNIPNHPDCFKIKSYATSCPNCGKRVVYYECTSGSKIFLDPPDGGQHNCGARLPDQKERAKLILELFEYAKRRDAEPLAQCPMCETEMKTANMPKHFKKCPGREKWFPRRDP